MCAFEYDGLETSRTRSKVGGAGGEVLSERPPGGRAGVSALPEVRGGINIRLTSKESKRENKVSSQSQGYSFDGKVFLLLDVALQIRPDEPSNIPSLLAVEVYHAPQRVCVNDDARENIFPMVFTLHTSHLEISPLNDDAE